MNDRPQGDSSNCIFVPSKGTPWEGQRNDTDNKQLNSQTHQLPPFSLTTAKTLKPLTSSSTHRSIVCCNRTLSRVKCVCVGCEGGVEEEEGAEDAVHVSIPNIKVCGLNFLLHRFSPALIAASVYWRVNPIFSYSASTTSSSQPSSQPGRTDHSQPAPHFANWVNNSIRMPTQFRFGTH